MLKLYEVDKWLKYLRHIIFDINVSINNIKRITSPTDDYEKQVVNHGFFNHYYQQSRFVIIVQLCKLFDERRNQKLNIFKLFDKLSNDEYDNKLQEKLKTNSSTSHLYKNQLDIIKDIDLLRTEIASQKVLIHRVIGLRDKFFAHSDPDSVLPNVNNPQLETLVKLAIIIYNSIQERLFDNTFLFEHNEDWKVDYSIKVLAAQRKDQAEELRQKTINK